MTSNYRSEEELEIRVQERTAELEKANQELRAEIIEHKRKEEALLQSEFRYQTLFNSVDEGFCVIEMIFDENEKPVDYRFLETNSAFEKQTGLIDAQGKRMRELAPEHEEHWFEIYGRVALTGEPVRFQNYAEKLNRWYEVYAFRFGEPEKRQVAIILNDITERKQTDEALRESEMRFRTMFEAHGAPMLLVEPNSGQIIDANDAAARFYEYSREQLRAMRIDQINQLPPEEVAAERQRAVERGKNVFIFLHRLASGDVRWVEVYSSPVTTQDQPVLFSIIHDITERKRAEEALKEAYDSLEEKVKERTAELEKAYNLLKESEEGLAEAQQMAHLGNWDWDITTNEMYWSDEIYRIFGRTPQEFGATYYGFLHYVHPEDRYYVNNAVKEALNGKTYSVDYRIIMSNGEERIVHEQAEVIFDRKNSPVRMKGTVQDITERKQVEDELKRTSEELKTRNQEIISERQRLYNVLETLPVAIVLLTPDHHITFANRVFRDKFGDLDSRKCYDFCFGLTRPCEFCEAFKVLETGKLHHWEATMPDGSVLDVYDLPFTDVDGSLKVLEMDIDITERKKAEEALARIDEARIKEIHHRIKNNLQVISSLLDLQAERFSHLETCNTPEVMEAFKNSQNRVASMALIHEELYQGKGTDSLDFAAYIKKLTRDLFSSYNLRKGDISLQMDLEQVFLGMDTAIPLGMVVNELVSNSLKHAFSEGKEWEIKISLKKKEDSALNRKGSEACGNCEPENGFQYILTVADNGTGIPEEINLQDADSLGLKLVNLLVEQIEGCIELRRNQGTEFTVWFSDTVDMN